MKLGYRRCAGVALFNKQGQIWLGHRRKNSESHGPNLWQLPQGGIDDGEKPLAAATRELWEETGVTTARKLLKCRKWLKYDLPDEILGKGLKGKYRGQKQAWFAFIFDGNDDEINISHPPKGAPVEFDEWRWADLNDITAEIVHFKRPVYERLIEEFGHLPDAIRDGEFD
ncbi:MAG: RNA pyrophosphohydrolase [Pseudomonadota bacterium]